MNELVIFPTRYGYVVEGSGVRRDFLSKDSARTYAETVAYLQGWEVTDADPTGEIADEIAKEQQEIRDQYPERWAG